jgi:hypothetical protein
VTWLSRYFLLFGLLLLSGCSLVAPSARSVGGKSIKTTAVKDLQGRTVDPFLVANAQAAVFLFVNTDCPISNRYAPEIERMYRKYSAQHVCFWLVYSDPTTTPDEIARHRLEYHLSLPALRDVNHDLVRLTGVLVTPEVAVFAPLGMEVYHGRIDDRYVDFGRERVAPVRRDLEEVLQTIIARQPVTNTNTKAVGCYISDATFRK